jgi:hypothetical protein
VLARLLEEQGYRPLAGQLLEGLGKLFAANVKLHAYQEPRENNGSAAEFPGAC